MSLYVTGLIIPKVR